MDLAFLSDFGGDLATLKLLVLLFLFRVGGREGVSVLKDSATGAAKTVPSSFGCPLLGLCTGLGGKDVFHAPGAVVILGRAFAE